jgi:hypothetical protein
MTITYEILDIPTNPLSKDMSLTFLTKTDLVRVPGNPIKHKDVPAGEQWYVLSTSDQLHPLYVGVRSVYTPADDMTRTSVRIVAQLSVFTDLGGTEDQEYYPVETVMSFNHRGVAFQDTAALLDQLSCTFDLLVSAYDGTDGHPKVGRLNELNFGQVDVINQ